MKITNNNPCAEITLGPISASTTMTAIDSWRYDPVEAFCRNYPHEEILEHLDKEAIMKYAITHCSKLGQTFTRR